VYDTATTVLPECIRHILAANRLQLSDVAMIIPHQPSMRVLKKTADLLEIPFSKIRTNMDLHANTAGATVPLLLDQVHSRGEISPGDLILFAAVGSGWTWGASLYRWQ
jgi:3-oxoacyl-[acyl-carrier-protein] synthase-3